MLFAVAVLLLLVQCLLINRLHILDGTTKNAEEKPVAVVIIDHFNSCLCFSPTNDFLDDIILGSVEFMS